MYELRRSRTNCDYSPKGWKWASGGRGSIVWAEKLVSICLIEYSVDLTT